MRKKIFSISFLCLSGAFALYFFFGSIGELSTYQSLKQQTPGKIFQWDIRESKEKFPITALYRFEAQGKVWQGAHRFGPPWDLNQEAAVHRLTILAKQPKMVWFDPQRPSHSSLEKNFPYNSLFRFAVSLGVFLYFGWVFSRSKFNPQ